MNTDLLDISYIDLSNIPPFTWSVFLLSSVILLKWLINRFVNKTQYDPLSAFQFYCQQLAKKVNKSSNSHSQQKIAGFIAIAVTIAPLVIILWLFEAFIEVLSLWQAMLLYFALGSLNLGQNGKRLAKLLVANKQYDAKKHLQHFVLRDTQPLSTMGLSKAGIEMQLLKTLQQQVTVVFVFITLGALAAFTYRLLLEMHYSWNTKQDNHADFGQPISVIVAILQWLPVRLFTLLLLLSTTRINITLCWRLIRGQFFQLNNNIALNCLALSLQTKLGGVAMYNGVKVRKISFNDQGRQPEPSDLIHADKQLKPPLLLGSITIIFIAIIIFFIGE
jgi:adenosylcobinamide-phosphate synthase